MITMNTLKQWQNGAKNATIVLDLTKVATGHKAHRGGSGSHNPSPKRERTRSAKNRKIMRDFD